MPLPAITSHNRTQWIFYGIPWIDIKLSHKYHKALQKEAFESFCVLLFNERAQIIIIYRVWWAVFGSNEKCLSREYVNVSFAFFESFSNIFPTTSTHPYWSLLGTQEVKSGFRLNSYAGDVKAPPKNCEWKMGKRDRGRHFCGIQFKLIFRPLSENRQIGKSGKKIFLSENSDNGKCWVWRHRFAWQKIIIRMSLQILCNFYAKRFSWCFYF